MAGESIPGVSYTPSVVTHQKRSEYKEHKSDNLYRLIFQLPPVDKVTVTIMQGDVVESKSRTPSAEGREGDGRRKSGSK